MTEDASNIPKGEILLEEGVLTREEILRALEKSGLSQSHVGQLLRTLATVTRSELVEFLGQKYEFPQIDLSLIHVSSEVIALVPREMAVRHEMIPIEKLGSILCVAKANVSNRAALQDLRAHSGMKVKVFQCSDEQVRNALERYYQVSAIVRPAPVGAQEPAAQLEAISVENDLMRIAKKALLVNWETEWERLYTTSGPLAAIRLEITPR